MARPRTYRRTFVMRWTPLEETIVDFYAQRHGWDQSAVIRSMIRKFARADADLDKKQLKRHFEERVLPEIKDDPEMVEEAKETLETFLKSLDG